MKVRRRTSAGPGLDWHRMFGWFQPGKWLAGLSGGNDLRLFLVTFAGFLLAGYLFAALVLFPAPFLVQRQTVPNTIGLPESEAWEAIRAQGLIQGETELVQHPTAATRTIVWQDPPPGVVVPEGTPVTLSRSQGPQQVPVPDVANYTGNLARLIVEAAGLTARIDSVQTPSARGIVVNTQPATGVTLLPGRVVRILVSLGAATVAVPDLAGLTLEEARDTLETIGLTMGNFIQRTSRGEPGTVVQQTPPAGTLAAPGTSVTGWIARERNR